MKRLARTTIYGSIAAAALCLASGPSFAVEPGDFNATLAGATIGIPLGAAPPPGLYGSLETFVGQGAGTGQNSAAAGANLGHGLTAFGEAITPSLIWVPGWNLFGGSVLLAAIQPLYTIGILQNNCTVAAVGCVGQPPIVFGTGTFFEDVHNTVWSITDSWNWKNGWFTSLGFNFQGPDGSQYNGTNNQDYWTFSPTAAISFINKTWKGSVNIDYDIHTRSEGHTGTYAAVASNVANPAIPAPNGCVGFACPGIGYTTGQQLFIDWSLEYRWGKLAFGPAGDFKFQTTADSPGSGWTCAALTNATAFGYGPDFSCGKARDVSLGGILGYDFGPAELEVFAVDSVTNNDDFKGWKVFTRLSFKLDDPSPKPAAAAPMVGKSH